MDVDETAELLPELLRDLYAGKYRPAGGGALPDYPGGWILEDAGAFCFIKTAHARRPFIWIRAGAAIEIPRSNDLAFFVACANKDLVAGRAYLRHGEQFALVAVDESISAVPISRAFSPSIQEVVTRLDFALQHARDLQWAIFERFGGREFSGDDWGNLVPDLEGTVLETRPSSSPT